MFTSFATGLAVFAISASAQYGAPQQQWGAPQGPQQTRGWGAPQPAQPQRPAPQGPQGPQRGQPRGAPQSQYGAWGQPQYGGYNNWGPPPPPVIPEGWYSATHQYSPPQIRYLPAETYEAVYAVCEFGDDQTLELSQLPHQAIRISGEFTVDDVDSEFSLRINTLGRLGDSCDATGDEFNPLTEVDHYGVRNPFQDPSRGTIPNFTSDENGEATIVGDTDILQNLSGPDSLIGRSITLFSADDTEKATPIGCCTIGRSAPPPPAPVVPPPAPQEDDWHYGGWGQPQHGGWQEPQAPQGYGGRGQPQQGGWQQPQAPAYGPPQGQYGPPQGNNGWQGGW